MELIGPTSFDFLGKRYVCFALSGLLLAISLWALFGGINRGIDFAGGTEIRVKFADPPALDDLRRALADQEIGDISMQRIGAPADNEFLIRVGASGSGGVVRAQEKSVPAAGPGAEEPSAGLGVEEASQDAPSSPPAASQAGGEAPQGEQERVYQAVLAVLREFTGVEHPAGSLDLNIAGEREIAVLLAAREGGAGMADSLAARITDYRKTHAGLFRSFEEVAQIEGMTPQVLDQLKEASYVGPFTIRRVDFVGPRVGKELAEKAYLAVFFALTAMLIYITVRFRNLGFALGGIAALIHDGIAAAGIYNLWGGMFDLSIVAAILTLLGYSINDTIVIFDRVRENMRAMRGKGLLVIFNASINQTLSRTLLTSLTTLLVVISLFLFGGETIHGFAFMLMFGIIVGTYSTIFIASPVAILYQNWTSSRLAGARSASPGVSRKPSRRRSAASR
ncbi:MAG: protein translocase subunit SecF [Acidobacteriota bacterium]